MLQSIKTDDLGCVQITNFRKAQMLIVFHKQKEAQLLEFHNMPENQRQKNYIDDFREMKDEDARYLGRETLDGVSALEYSYDKAESITHCDSIQKPTCRFRLYQLIFHTKILHLCG